VTAEHSLCSLPLSQSRVSLLPSFSSTVPQPRRILDPLDLKEAINWRPRAVDSPRVELVSAHAIANATPHATCGLKLRDSSSVTLKLRISPHSGHSQPIQRMTEHWAPHPSLPPHPRLLGRAHAHTVLVAEACPLALRRQDSWSLADFKLVERVHVGRSSSVYRARCRRSGEPVALKVITKRTLSALNWCVLGGKGARKEGDGDECGRWWIMQA
jgi:hypothetical protein